MTRLDAIDKARGATRYIADTELPGMYHAAIVRSSMVHARIVGVQVQRAQEQPGVIGVYTAADITANTYGRAIRDIPILAQGVVRYVGERVVAVVAKTREQAEAAAAFVEVDYEPLPAVISIDEARATDAPAVHEEPWNYPNPHVTEADPRNLQAAHAVGSLEKAEAALAMSDYVVDQVYRTPGVHQGYLEPQACIADVSKSGTIRLLLTNKSPYLVRKQIADCFDIDPLTIDVQPVPIGGDFGGKGSPGDAPLCIELSRLTGHPVKTVMRYSEDLIATNPRHPTDIHMRVGSDKHGAITCVIAETDMDGGAYSGMQPGDRGIPGGVFSASGYRIPSFYAQASCWYTNSVPKGNMRAPGSPQMAFALESALDELAQKAGLTPIEIRRKNFLVTGEHPATGHGWIEYRGDETLDAAVEALVPKVPPTGWVLGVGLAVAARDVHANANTVSAKVSDDGADGVIVEVSSVETGTGSHTVMQKLISEQLGIPADKVKVIQVSTGELKGGVAAGGSAITRAFALTADAVEKAWRDRIEDIPIVVDCALPTDGETVGTFTIQIAQVAVDLETGALRVLQILTAADIGNVINDLAHQMQVDGGTLMGFGFGCLEDLVQEDGQIWAANLGEFKIASERDAPELKTVLVQHGRGVGSANVKPIGESTTPPTAAAIANAVFAATGCRIRDLPITAERIYEALQQRDSAS